MDLNTEPGRARTMMTAIRTDTAMGSGEIPAESIRMDMMTDTMTGRPRIPGQQAAPTTRDGTPDTMPATMPA